MDSPVWALYDPFGVNVSWNFDIINQSINWSWLYCGNKCDFGSGYKVFVMVILTNRDEYLFFKGFFSFGHAPTQYLVKMLVRFWVRAHHYRRCLAGYIGVPEQSIDCWSMLSGDQKFASVIRELMRDVCEVGPEKIVPGFPKILWRHIGEAALSSCSIYIHSYTCYTKTNRHLTILAGYSATSNSHTDISANFQDTQVRIFKRHIYSISFCE